MKEFIEKLIGRLEESVAFPKMNRMEKRVGTKQTQGFVLGVCNSVQIVNELTEECRPKTQADKIRSMSDEELAGYIIFIGDGYDEKIPYCKSTPQCTEILDEGRIVSNEMCRECLIKWLQSEAE